MTLPRLREITAYHGKHPPVHVLIASQMGVGHSSGIQSSKPREIDEQGRSLFDVAPRT